MIEIKSYSCLLFNVSLSSMMNRWIRTKGVFLISIFSMIWLVWLGISYWINGHTANIETSYSMANDVSLFDKFQIYVKDTFNTHSFCETHTVFVDETRNNSREPYKSIALIKVYKAASSTLSNILFRYGFNRKMSFILPQGVGQNQIFPLSPSDSEAKIIPLCKDGQVNHAKSVAVTDLKYQLLNVHTRFRGKSNLLQLLPNDTFILSSVREPVYQIKSSFSYNGFEKRLKKFNIDFKTFFETPYKITVDYFFNGNETNMLHATDWGLWNPQSLVHGLSEFGVRPGITRTELINSPEEMKKVKSFLNSVHREIDFSVIAEYFDQSIVIMRNLLGLEWEDIVYLESNKRSKKQGKMDMEERKKILEWNYIDYLLYETMKEKFYKLKNEIGEERIMAEAGILSEYNERIASYCLSHKRYQPRQGVYVSYMEFEMSRRGLRNKCCNQMTAQEWNYIPTLKQYMWRKCELH